MIIFLQALYNNTVYDTIAVYGHSRQSVYSSVKRRGAIGYIVPLLPHSVLLSNGQIELWPFSRVRSEMGIHDALHTSVRIRYWQRQEVATWSFAATSKSTRFNVR